MQKIHENNFSVSKKTNVISNSTESEKYLVWNLNHRSGSYITRNKHVSFPFFIHSQSDLFDAWNDKRNNGITSIKLFEKHLDFVWIFFFSNRLNFQWKCISLNVLRLLWSFIFVVRIILLVISPHCQSSIDVTIRILWKAIQIETIYVQIETE